MSAVHLVVPDGIDDPARPSGGNTYDRRVRDTLAETGWTVVTHPAPGGWPEPDRAARAALAATVAGLPDGAAVLVDGLIASCVPDVLVPAAGRLRVVVLVHMPLGGRGDRAAEVREGAVLAAADAVVTTSAWTRMRLLDLYRLSPTRVYVAEPGVDPAPLAPGSGDGGDLLCVAAVTAGKGHDVLLSALAKLDAAPWRLTCAGTLDRDPAFTESLRRRATEDGIAARIRFTGPLAGDDLDRAYAGADLLVLASHAETYGMVVTEALARGLPVVVTSVGGLPEAVGRGTRRAVPGLFVPPDDPGALAGALGEWLGDGGVRARLRRTARQRRATLRRWAYPAALIARVLREAAA